MSTVANNITKNGVNGTTNNTANAKSVNSDKLQNSTPVVVSPSTEILPALQVIEAKTAFAVFERLEQGMKMKEQFQQFKEKVDEFDSFAKDYEDEGLQMEIRNVGTNQKVVLKSVPMILDFIQNVVVKAGREHLKQMEGEIIKFAI